MIKKRYVTNRGIHLTSLIQKHYFTNRGDPTDLLDSKMLRYQQGDPTDLLYVYISDAKKVLKTQLDNGHFSDQDDRVKWMVRRRTSSSPWGKDFPQLFQHFLTSSVYEKCTAKNTPFCKLNILPPQTKSQSFICHEWTEHYCIVTSFSILFICIW